MRLKDRIKAFFTRSHVRKSMVFLTVATLCGFTTVVILTSQPADSRTAVGADTPVTGMPVSTRSIEPEGHAAVIKVLGEVAPLWQTAIKAQVDGQVVFLSERLQVGHIVHQDELLVQIAKSDFEGRVAEAKSRLAAANVSLLKEEREAWEARKNWKQSGIKGAPKSPLVLRKPQLTAAQAEVEAAQATLVHAKTLLGYTDIRSPFDGVITKRSLDPGETLFAGDEVATLYGMEIAEVGVHLDAAQWALLPESINDAKVKLIDPQQHATWDARVARESRHLSRDSRLRTIFLQVKQPLQQKPPLLPGTFVRAEMTGKAIPDLLCIPEAALTKQGIVWFVDSGNRLQPRRSEPVFYGEGVVYIHTPDAMGRPVRIATAPNSSFTSGLVIQPITETKEQ